MPLFNRCRTRTYLPLLVVSALGACSQTTQVAPVPFSAADAALVNPPAATAARDAPGDSAPVDNEAPVPVQQRNRERP